jgi:predicted N-acyltransferase
MHTKIYSSITDIEEKNWNSIIGRNGILRSYRFLLTVEKSNINDCKYYYPVVYDNDKIAAHACVYSITTDLDTLSSNITKKIILFVRLLWKNFLKIKFLECGSPIAIGNLISFSDDIDKEKALNLLVDCIETLAKINDIGVILIRDFYENDINFFNHLIGRKYKRVNNLPDTILNIKWVTFNQYLHDIKSYFRSKIIKKIKIANNNNLIFEIHDNFSHIADQLQILWYNVYNNAKEYKREILTKEFFINLETYLNGKAKVILSKKDSKIVGFALILVDDDSLRFMYSGIDYNVNREYSVYFNSIYRVINQAIVEGKKDIDAGISTYLPKIEIGAEMVNLYMYMKHTNILLNPIITNLFNLLTPKVKLKNSNIFKEEIENKIEKSNSIVHNYINI